LDLKKGVKFFSLHPNVNDRARIVLQKSIDFCAIEI